MKKTLLIALACLAILAGFGIVAKKWIDAEYEKEQLAGEVRVQKARLNSQAKQFEELAKVAEQLQGSLVAAIRIRVPPETLYIPIKESVTQLRDDSSRYAVRTDTLSGGYIVRQEAEAPPYPAPLRLGATLTTPEFAPEVGFVRSSDGQRYHAAVRWQGKEFTIEDAFHLPVVDRIRPHLSLYAGGAAVERSGGEPWEGTHAYLALRYHPNTRWSLGLESSIAGEKMIGFRVERKIWSHRY